MTDLLPLVGLKAVELARVLAGPWAGQVLADLGASVVKVESLGGDDTRQCEVVSRPAGVPAVLAEAGDGAVDESRIEPMKLS